MVREEIEKYFQELIEQNIATYFRDEQDELLLKLFRSFYIPLTEFSTFNPPTDLPSLIAHAEDPAILMQSQDIFFEHFQNFNLDNPTFEGAKNLPKMMQLLLSLMSSWSSSNPLNNQAKIDVIKATKSGAIEYLNIQNDEGIKEYMKPFIEHNDILIDKHRRKAEIDARSQNEDSTLKIKQEYFLIPLFHLSKIEKIANYLALKGIIRNPKLFVLFCNGEDVQIEVVQTKHQEFFYLYTNHIYNRAVKLNNGKRFLKHLSEHILDFSNSLKSSTASQYLSNIGRKNPLDTNTVKGLGETIDSLLR